MQEFCAMRPALLTICVLCFSTTVLAQAPTLAGRMGERALVVVDGRSQVIAPGQSAGGLKLVRWLPDGTALVEQGGRSFALAPGGAPSAVGPAVERGNNAREVVIPAGPGGHFITTGSINGRSVQFMVDTGATVVALSQAEAQRLNIDLRAGRPGLSQTAGGTVPVVAVMLPRLRVGEVELANVQAVVLPSAMPYVLLGNSVLDRFQMRRDNDLMRLVLR
jgi:aspartyl protease family protein